MPSFFVEAIRRRKEVGAVAASGKHLAEAMTSSIGSDRDESRVLEVGAGTGAFTNHILHRLGPGGTADIVELNPKFCHKLRDKVVGPWSSNVKDRSAKVIEGCIEEVDLKPDYTNIICGLPFNSFAPRDANRILSQLVSLLAPNGTLVYFEYAGLPGLRRTFPGPWQRKAKEHNRFIQELSHSMSEKRILIFRNFPPAWAVSLRAKGG